ncbi:MAG: DNA polymerase II large subunit [Candidatus Nanoarchaeia archaeon]|nr:DNA polymerase II large subunit [Candidatus Nanoarchaeia archaeon]MDD5741398.1 DNA polymerase II large subunit [Candidatus Nanoarchaeia archaeon]
MGNGYLPETEKYFAELGREIQKNYEIAEQARGKGFDPVDKVEVSLALTMAAKVVRLIATLYPQLDREDIINRILELEKQHGALDSSVAFKIAEEISMQKYCQFKDQLEAIDAGIRIGFAYITLGVVSSPIEGYTGIKTGKTQDGKTYVKAFFSGPIRSAGTTATCVALILIDYLRQLFGYARFDPVEKECKRIVTELYDYHERVTNLQYLPTEEEVYFLVKNLPIQIAGDPTEDKEVSNYKNLERVETDFIRGGLCLALGEGLAQKAAKGLRILKGLQRNGFKIDDWDWLEKYVELHERRQQGKTDASPTYIKDLVAGRPVFGHPGKGFRFRYGRSRDAGFSGVSVHPATMAVTNDFIAAGTQLKIEKPTKGCVVMCCDSIDGPIVKLENGNVKKLDNYEETKTLYKEIKEIIYLGDMLFPLGDVINRNAVLPKPGYVEEWWGLELEKAIGNKELKENGLIKEQEIVNRNYRNVDIEEAIELSEKYEVPLHPEHIFYWTQISWEEFLGVIDWFNHSRIIEYKLIFPYNKNEKERFQKGKRALELLGVPHLVGIENVILEKKETQALLLNFGFEIDFLGELSINFDLRNYNDKILELNKDEDKNKGSSSEGKIVLEIINKLSKFKIKDKAGEFIGTRMGRPEKAKLRKLTGSPSVLFPIGNEGGRLRSVNEAVSVGYVNSTFPFNYCNKCKKESIYRICEDCNEKTEKKYFCRSCNKEITEKCQLHDRKDNFKETRLDVKHYFEKAVEKLGLFRIEVPVLIKGVRGTSSESHNMENLSKGILRSKYGLCVNKDGTIRYDMTELPLTHFKPKEIEVSIEKLKELGYEKDYLENELINEEQILELKPHDIIIPCNNLAGDDKADDVFVKAANFIDELLIRLYGLPAFYNVKNRNDLIGKLGVCMAPHNCAGVISRIIGFSKVQGLLASPYMHAAMRRDCDGDEAALMLLLDVLINFSRKFLPAHRGGTQDAPLVLNGQIHAKEVDDQILDFELVNGYPLELYEKAEKRLHSKEVQIESVKKRLKGGKDPFVNLGFTHSTSNFNDGATCSSYKTLPTMQEKVKAQMDLCVKLRSVDQGDVARLIIDRHFMRDLKGNLRKFSQQGFRCSTCNTIYRRPPLSGKCECGGRIIFTISYGSIVKYLEPALDLTRNFDVPAYIKQDLELTKRYIESIFGKDNEKQESMDKWFG